MNSEVWGSFKTEKLKKSSTTPQPVSNIELIYFKRSNLVVEAAAPGLEMDNRSAPASSSETAEMLLLQPV